MDEQLISLLDKVKNDVKETDEYRVFYDIQKEIESDEEIMRLSYLKDQALINYEVALRHYGENDANTLKASKEMSQAIYELSNHPLVKKYNKALESYNLLLNEFAKEAFGEFND